MVYLHVAQAGRRPPFSPLDKLYEKLDRCVPTFEVADVLNAHDGRRSHAAYSLTLGNCVPWMQSADAARHPWSGHIDQCSSCGHLRISYNSCRNRHCPKCQQIQRERWILAREVVTSCPCLTFM